MVVKQQNHKREIAEREVYNPRKLCYRGCLQRGMTQQGRQISRRLATKIKDPQKKRLLAETHAHTNAHMHTPTSCTETCTGHAHHYRCRYTHIQPCPWVTAWLYLQ